MRARPVKTDRMRARLHALCRSAPALGEGTGLRRRLCSDALPAADCVKFEHVVQAHHRCRGHLVNTNILHSHWLSQETGSEIVLKMEQQQFTGSFKERGACNALLSLSSEVSRAGVKAASAGNHALALSYHGANLGIPVTVVMPTVAPLAKVDKCRALGANVIVHGTPKPWP